MTHSSRRPAPLPPARRPTGWIAGFFAFLLMAAATILIVLAAVLSMMVAVLLTPASWLDALDASGAYERAPAAIAEQVVQWVDAQPASQPRTLAPLDRSDIEAIILTLTPPEWLRTQAASIVPAAVEGATTTADSRVAISLQPLKLQLTSPALLSTVLGRVSTWPACTDAQVKQLATGVLSRCRPTDAAQSQLAVAVAGLFAVVANEIPASVDLATPGSVPGSGALASTGILGSLRMASVTQPVLTSLVLLVILLLAGAALLAGRTLPGVLRTVAIPLLAGGLVALALSLIVDSFLGGVVGALRASLAAGSMAPAMVAIASSMALAMVDRAGWHLLQVGAPLVLAGLLMLILHWHLGRRAAGRGRLEPPVANSTPG